MNDSVSSDFKSFEHKKIKTERSSKDPFAEAQRRSSNLTQNVSPRDQRNSHQQLSNLYMT